MGRPNIAFGMAAQALGKGVGGIGEMLYETAQNRMKQKMADRDYGLQLAQYDRGVANDAYERDPQRLTEKMLTSGYAPLGPGADAPEGVQPVEINGGKYFDTQAVNQIRANKTQHEYRLGEIAQGDIQPGRRLLYEQDRDRMNDALASIESFAEDNARRGVSDTDSEKQIMAWVRNKASHVPLSLASGALSKGRARYYGDVQGFRGGSAASGQTPQKMPVSADQFQSIVREYQQNGLDKQAAQMRAASKYVISQ